MNSLDTPQRPASRHRLAFFGPALGGHEGWVTTQGEVLAGLFGQHGYNVRVSSTQLHPLRRATDHARDLVRWRRKIDVAIVSVFSGKAFALADEALTLAKALGIPTVAWLHGGNLPDFGADHPRWASRVMRRADAVVAPSAFLQRWAQDLATGSRVIPNVLNLDAYRFRTRSPLRPRLLWMRTFQELYDPTAAIRTLAHLRTQGIDASLTMAGQDKGLLAETWTTAETLNVEALVTFPGFVSGEQKARLFDDNDIFLNTNIVDNAPVTVLEAAASGLAVVSTNAGGLQDLLPDGVAARLVPPRDPAATAEAIRHLLNHQKAADSMIKQAHGVATRSAWPSVQDEWTQLFHEISGQVPRG